MKKNLKFILLFILFNQTNIGLFSQNLIFNGDFETYASRHPIDKDTIKTNSTRLEKWHSSPIIRSAHWNIFDKDKRVRYCTHNNIARSGNICTSVRIYDNINIEHNLFSYNNLITNFTKPLEKGKQYKISFYVKPFIGDFLSDKFEVYISEDLHQDLAYKEFEVIKQKGEFIVEKKNKYSPTFSIDKVIEDTKNYTKIEFIYKAKGNELYIYFGNITGDIPKTMIKKSFGYKKSIKHNPPRIILIDDLSVLPYDTTEKETKKISKFVSIEKEKTSIENLKILFQENSFVIKKEPKAILNSFFRNNKNISIDSVSLIGNTNNTGTTKNNLILAKNRIQTISKFLIDSILVDSSKISFTVNGEIELDTILDIEKQKINNRNVKIKVFYKDLEEDFIQDSIQIIYFEENSVKILPQSKETFENLLVLLKKHKNQKVDLLGHICCLNYENGREIHKDYYISKDRARFIYAYLVKNGIDKNRIVYSGCEEDFPLYEENGPGHYLNRRVEVRFLDVEH